MLIDDSSHTYFMSLSHSDIPCPRTRVIGVCIFVLLAHIGLLLAISTTSTVAHVPSMAINMLESFVIEHPDTEKVSPSVEPPSLMANAELEGKHTPPQEEPIPVKTQTVKKKPSACYHLEK